ncbi:MAG: hypothetical protein OXN17_18895 [Candidatus Poribacteria bacterium]|nr:hypothetical protein [Candidatus Poribacteria bacterium]MDE0503551.1 hypothetical protein [Candidatus Poribacteria bacterium]
MRRVYTIPIIFFIAFLAGLFIVLHYINREPGSFVEMRRIDDRLAKIGRLQERVDKNLDALGEFKKLHPDRKAEIRRRSNTIDVQLDAIKLAIGLVDTEIRDVKGVVAQIYEENEAFFQMLEDDKGQSASSED